MRSERASPATAGLGRVVVVGGGLVGLATAWRLLQSRRCDEVTLLEKDAKVASQQSTHNSGVLHSGLYYKPGSEKAALSVRGLRQMVEFCREHGVRHEICGKIVVATDLAARGIPVNENIPLPADIFEKQAQRRVTLGLILSEVVRGQSLQAKPEQVRALVEELAQSYEHPQEVVKWFYQSPDRLRDIESVALEENVVNWALATAQVKDEAVTFDELMGNGQ
jgi:hypothetical protein